MVQIGRPSIVQRHGQLERFTASLIVPVRGTLEQRISYIDCNLCDEMLRNCCSSPRSSPTTTSSEPSFSVPITAVPLLQLAAIRPSTLQHCRPGARTPWHADTAPPWILQSALTSAWRGTERTRQRGECCILHLPWPGARQLVVCPGARCFLVLIGKIILLTSLGMITRKQEQPSLWDRNYVSQFIWFLIVLQRQTQTPGSTTKYKSSNMYNNVNFIFIFDTTERICMHV